MKSYFDIIGSTTRRMGASIILFVLFIAAAHSQVQSTTAPPAGPSAEERAKNQTQKMKTDLKLTSAQEPKVYDINLKYCKLIDEAKKNGQDRNAQRKLIEGYSKDQRSELTKVLTPEQVELSKKILEEKRQKRGAGR